MLETVAMRGLAALSTLLALAVGWSLAVGSGSWRQALAKLVLALLLLALARLAWRRPLGRAERARRRVLRLVAVLLSPELRRQWAESSPATNADDALRADLRAAVTAPPDVLGAAFDAEELAHVNDLRAALERDGPAGLGGPDALAAARAIQEAALRRARGAAGGAGSASGGVG